MTPEAQKQWDDWARSIVRRETEILAGATGEALGKFVNPLRKQCAELEEKNADLTARLEELENAVALMRALKLREDA